MYKRIVPSQEWRLKLLRAVDCVPDAMTIRLQYFLKFGRWANLGEPRRLTEKLQWYKLFYRDPLMQRCSDKLAVKEYLAEIGAAELVTPTYGVYKMAEEFDFLSLPRSFVLKSNVGAKKNIVVKDKTEIDQGCLEDAIRRWSSEKQGKTGREWCYYGLEPAVFSEEYLPSVGERGLIDYKFYCFDGEPRFLYVIDSRESAAGPRLGIYDLQFRQLPFWRADLRRLDDVVERPSRFDEMVEWARRLSAPFPHVRVDLYQVGEEVRFGEFTFYSGAGYGEYIPDEFDFTAGRWFRLPPVRVPDGA